MTSRRMMRVVGAAALLYAVASPAFAIFGIDDDKPEEKVFEESTWTLPAPPQDADLLTFYAGMSGLSFSIDAKSLTVDKDGVARFTMVATSKSGAKSVSYEGIRCETREHKLYASGHPDGTWGKARDPQWLPIPTTGTNLQHHSLAEDYICKDGRKAGKPSAIINDLRYHRAPFSPQT